MRRLAGPLLLLPFVLTLLGLLRLFSSRSNVPAPPPPPTKDRVRDRRTPSTLDGKWVRSSLPPAKLLQKSYKQRAVPGRCQLPSPPVGLSGAELEEMERKRWVEHARWIWQPDFDMRGWTLRDLLGRMVASRRGFAFIGDASGEAQYLALVELLLAFQPDTVSPPFSEPIVVPITKAEAPGGRTSLAWIRSNFRHPFHRQLKSRYPSIPAMRFSRPIATFYRSDLLLHQPATELPQILADSAISDIELAHPVNESLVGHELFFDRWKKGKGVWDLMRDDVVVVSAGGVANGWSMEILGVKSDEEVLRVFGAMVNSLLPRLLGQPDVNLVVRSTVSLPACSHDSTSAVKPTSSLTDDHFNAIWLAALDRHDPDRRVTWMDVGRMRREGEDGQCDPCVRGLWWHWVNAVLMDVLPSQR